MELEALQEQFFLLKEGRITLLGEQLQRLRGELACRDLTEVPTDKIFELLIKYHLALKEEAVEVRPLSVGILQMAGFRGPLLHHSASSGQALVGADRPLPTHRAAS
jgi:hypothetical protein